MTQQKSYDEHGDFEETRDPLDSLLDLGFDSLAEEHVLFDSLAEEEFVVEVEEKTPGTNLDQIIAESRNNDAVVKVEKSFEAQSEELCYLITKFFGEDAYISDHRSDFKPLKIDKFFEIDRAFFASELSLHKGKKSLFKRTRDKYAKITPVQEQVLDEDGKHISVNMILSRHGFNPIKVTAYTPEALPQAKVFANAYKKLTGKEAGVVQGFASKEEIEEKLSKEKKRHNPEIYPSFSEAPKLEAQITQVGGKANFSLEHEVSIPIPETLENTIKVQEGDKVFLYTGTFQDIRFTGDGARGNAFIQKKEVITTKRKKLIKYFPPRLEEVDIVKEKEVWTIMASYTSRSTLLYNGQLVNHVRFLSDNYRTNLKDRALNENRLVLSEKLLTELFSPIEQTLLDVYRKIKNTE